MATPSLLFILLLLSTLHACDARHRLQLFEHSNPVSRLGLLAPIPQEFRTDQPERSLNKNIIHKVSSSVEIGIGILKVQLHV